MPELSSARAAADYQSFEGNAGADAPAGHSTRGEYESRQHQVREQGHAEARAGGASGAAAALPMDGAASTPLPSRQFARPSASACGTGSPRDNLQALLTRSPFIAAAPAAPWNTRRQSGGQPPAAGAAVLSPRIPPVTASTPPMSSASYARPTSAGPTRFGRRDPAPLPPYNGTPAALQPRGNLFSRQVALVALMTAILPPCQQGVESLYTTCLLY